MLRQQIHLLESLGHRKSPRPVATIITWLVFSITVLPTANILDPRTLANRPGPVRRPVHHAGIQLHLASSFGQSAITHRVVVRIVFDHRDRRHHRVQRVPALFENVHAFIERSSPFALEIISGRLPSAAGARFERAAGTLPFERVLRIISPRLQQRSPPAK